MQSEKFNSDFLEFYHMISDFIEFENLLFDLRIPKK